MFIFLHTYITLLSVLSCGSVCRSCVTVIARLASTHTALVSQSLVGLCFAFPSINQCCERGLYLKNSFELASMLNTCELVCVCVSFVRVVIICPASTHTALVSSPSLTVVHLSTYIHHPAECLVLWFCVSLLCDRYRPSCVHPYRVGVPVVGRTVFRLPINQSML